MIDIDQMAKRVNLACNYWADTVGIDYVSELTIKEIREEDASNKESFFLFKQELSKCGY